MDYTPSPQSLELTRLLLILRRTNPGGFLAITSMLCANEPSTLTIDFHEEYCVTDYYSALDTLRFLTEIMPQNKKWYASADSYIRRTWLQEVPNHE